MNSSGKIVKRLHGTYVRGFRVDGEMLDLPLEERAAAVSKLLNTKRRIAALALGMNCNMPEHFRLERTGKNEIDTRHLPELIGGPRVTSILPDDPLYLINRTVNFGNWALELHHAGFKVAVSDDAGTIGCNAVTYSMLAARRDQPLPLLFMHIRGDSTSEGHVLRKYWNVRGPAKSCADKALVLRSVYSSPLERTQAGVEMILEKLADTALSNSALPMIEGSEQRLQPKTAAHYE